MSNKPSERLNGNPIADLSIREPVLISMLMALLLVVGGLAYSRMPVNLLPDFAFPVVQISVPYPGAGPETVATQVIELLEDEVSTLSGVDRITSTAAEGIAVVVVEFREGVDPAQALQDVRERVVALRPSLPDAILEPELERFDPAQEPVLTLAVISRSGVDSAALRQELEDRVVPLVQQASGVGATTLTGGQVRQINVELDLIRLQSLGISPLQVSRAISAASVDLGIGDVTNNNRALNLRVDSVVQSPADIAAIGIRGTNFTVGDVATVQDGFAEQTTLARLNGVNTLTLDVRRQSGANTVAVADAALRAFERAAQSNPDLAYTVVRNDADAVRLNVLGAIEEICIALGSAILVVMAFFSGLRRMLHTALLPALVLLVGLALLPAFGITISEIYPIVLAVVLLVVRTFFTDRNTFITVIGLPVIILGTFAGMALFGLSINIITLLAISVSVGLVIDDAIVVRENIIHRLEQGDSPRQAASQGAAEVALSVLAMTLTIVAVFVPVTFTTGITGIIFQSFGITVAIAMLLSLLEAYTFAPMLSAALIRSASGDPQAQHTTPAQGSGRGARFYGRLITWSLRHRWSTLGSGGLVIALTVALAGGVQTAFLPPQEDYRFGASFQLPAGTLLAETDERARAFEQIVRQDPAVRTVLTTVGDASGAAGGEARARFLVILDRSTPTQTVINRLRPQLAIFPRLALIPTSYQSGTNTDVTARQIQLQLRSTGDANDLTAVVAQVEAALRDVRGLTDLDTTYTPGVPALRYMVDQGRANDYGLTNQELAVTLRTLVNGATVATYREGGASYDVVVRLRPEDRANPGDLRRLQLPLGDLRVPLSAVVTVAQDTSPTIIRRVDRQNEVVIGASASERNLNAVVADIQQRLALLTLPAGVTVEFGGASAEQAEGFIGLLIAMGLSVVFVYMVLASQFRSFSQPLVLMLAMPLSFIGAFLALQITGRELDILAMIGMLMLLGLVVKNSILLVDVANNLRAQGADKHDALVQAGVMRLRPIMMTSLTIVFGVLPAAVGFGYGAALRQGLATVIIGGMITSTLLTLLLVPAAYSLLDSALARLKQPPRSEPYSQQVQVEGS